MLRQQEEEIEQLQRQLTERQREKRQQLASAAPNSVSSPASRDAAERTSATDDDARNRYESHTTHTRAARTHARTHTHTFNGPFPGTTRVSRYQKGKTDLDFAEARDSEWQWHQLGHMQVCTSLQTNNHASTPPLSFYRPDALPAAQPTASKH